MVAFRIDLQKPRGRQYRLAADCIRPDQGHRVFDARAARATDIGLARADAVTLAAPGIAAVRLQTDRGHFG